MFLIGINCFILKAIENSSIELRDKYICNRCFRLHMRFSAVALNCFPIVQTSICSELKEVTKKSFPLPLHAGFKPGTLGKHFHLKESDNLDRSAYTA